MGTKAPETTEIVVQKAGPREYHIIEGLCSGETINIEIDGKSQTAIVHVFCRPLNATTGEYLGESEPLEAEDGEIRMMMTLEELDEFIERHQLDNIGNQSRILLPLDDIMTEGYYERKGHNEYLM